MSLRVIAIDGPAASGKSSTAALVARRLGWAHLDSGALYRAITLAVLDNLGETAGERGKGKGKTWGAQHIVALAEDLPVRLVLVDDAFRPEVAGVDVAQAIRSERVTERVSEIAAIPEVRHWVNVQQREAVQDHPRGVVVDGRDIGTVVFPDAPLKVFLTASPEERARRRLAERGGSGGPPGKKQKAKQRRNKRKHNIRVVAICPGSVATPFMDKQDRLRPNRERVLTADDVAHAVLATVTIADRAMVSELDIRPTNP